MTKCIDVSSYQGEIDWAKVKASGISHAILKIIRKDLNPDKKFEQNWAGCTSCDVTIQGVYNYSYATTVEKARSDAQRVLSVLNGRKCTVWLDVEDKCQQGLGTLLIDIINAYGDIITSAGYHFGIYTGMSFYKSYIKPYFSDLKYKTLWCARYYNGYNKMQVSSNPNEKYNPENFIGTDIFAWQYTSSGQVPGIKGNVDLNVIYGNISHSPNPSAPIYGRVANCFKLNMRKAPKVEAGNVLQVLSVNTPLQLLKEAGGWYKVRTNNNLTGYVSKKYVKKL